ncbi:MAG: hypothetical protein ACI9UN_004940 [Granulosicoccus sp.]|jgi:hypothetical protein
MNLYYAIPLFIVSSFSFASATQILNTHIYHYDIFSEAEDLGDISVKVVNHADGSYIIAESTVIETAGFWGDTNLSSTQVETYSPEGKLLNADVKTLHGEVAHWRKAELSGDELWASYTQVQNVTEKEEEQLIGVALTIATNTVPGLGDALGIAQLLFSDEKPHPNNIRFSKNTYDTSFSNLPFYWSSKQNSLPTKLNLFNSEKLAVNTFQVEFLGKKIIQLETKDNLVTTSHYKLHDPEGQRLEVWLATSEFNSPYFYQLVGTDDDGPFHILFKKHAQE